MHRIKVTQEEALLLIVTQASFNTYFMGKYEAVKDRHRNVQQYYRSVSRQSGVAICERYTFE